MHRYIYPFLFGLFIHPITVAQSPLKKATYSLEAGTFLSTAPSTPFWLRSNQYGEVPLASNYFTLRGQIEQEYDSIALASKKKLTYGYGLRAVANLSTTNQFLLPEWYGKVRYGAFELYAGRRREIMGLVDSTLSAGSFIWSGNALPLPKLQISIPDYTYPFKNGLIALKGNFAHGWFGSGDSVKNYYLHQKSLYFRLGKPQWRFKFHGGINHQVQWGGRPTVPFYDAITKTTVSKFANSLEAYFNIVAGLPVSYEDRRFVTGGQVYGEGNRIGNNLGSVDIALEYEGTGGHWLVYRQSVYEDGSLYYLSNISDGLSGISWQNKKGRQGIRKIVVEYLQTSNQGGPYSARIGLNYLRGQDNYFNNGVYEDGWVYRRQTMGTPFVMPLRYSTGLPLNEEPLQSLNPYYIFNNRVQAFTVSVQSQIQRVSLTTRVSNSRNFGNYRVDYPLSVKQLSLQQQVVFPIRQYTVLTTFAYDNAGLLEKNLGVSLLVKRTF